MKKKLLVVGDSFMRPDIRYPGQHWSEMLPEFEIIMRSQDGSSNGIIAYNFYQGLDEAPDAAVLGFSFTSRIEFLSTASSNHGSVKWTTGSDRINTTKEQQQFADMHQIHVDAEMQQIKDTSIARSMMSMLQARGIPFAWTLNGLFNDLSVLPYPSDPWVNFILGDFMYCQTSTNLATYPDFKTSPGFHVDSPVWQQRFANEVREILQKSVDFSI